MLHQSILFTLSAIALARAAITASVSLPTDAAGITAAALTLDNGNYIFTNVATNQTLTYDRASNGQELFPEDGEGSPIALQSIGDYTVIKPAASNGKCMSAQWDYDVENGVNWAGALYQCRVGQFALAYSRRSLDTRAQIKLRLVKQYWYLIPGSTDGAYKIIPVDHLLDMDPRAIGSGIRNARSGGMKYPELVLNDNTDLNQEWFITATDSDSS